MITTSEICDDEQRRNAVRQKHLNGVDYVEISEDQRTLVVFFLEKAPPHITPANVRIDGGQRVRNLQITEIRLNRSEDEERDDCMTIDLDRPGDFSTYTLRLVQPDANGRPGDQPLQGFDPRYAQLDFSFKVGCPSDLDCVPADTCPPTPLVEPEINYLAKDYASFRQLLLDRLALTLPAWQERHVPDMGIALVEVLAYAGDHLSYYQDAVATEAYLDTARQRISVRRHARLVDYFIHEGCNARAWLCVTTDTDLSLNNPRDVYFITGHNNALHVTSHILTPDDLRDVPASSYEVFEPLLEQALTYFRPSDFKQPASFAGLLRDAPDDVSRYLQERLSAPARQWLKKFDGSAIASAALQQYVIDELNRLIRNISFDMHAFTAVALRPETQALLRQNPQGDDLARLNRMLLEDAYPAEIVSSSEIYLYAAHSEIHFYTWGNRECCLPRGATTATLRDGDKTTRSPGPAAQNPPATGRAPATKAPAAPGQPNSENRGPLHLQVGDVLILEEILGPKTLEPVDADPTHRQAVRLTRVERSMDAVYDQPIVEIEWAAEDALQFPLCLSVIGPAPDCKYQEDISVARGNVILVDHGATLVTPEELGQVPVQQTTAVCECEGAPTDIRVIAGRFQPRLQKGPLTFSQPLPANLTRLPVLGLLSQNPRRALPEIGLTSVPATLDGKAPLFHLDDVTDPDKLARQLHDPQDAASRLLRALLSRSTERLLARYSGAGPVPASLRAALMSELTQRLQRWTAQPDLLESQLDDAHFVVETDNDGYAHLRFGDGELGRQPSGGSAFYASYRVGNGLAGNVGAEAISHIVFRQTKLTGAALQVRNPLPSQGGLDAEPLAEIKLFAPQTFRAELQRAVSADDYARIAESKPQVQRAAAALRWTGSRYEVQVAIDPLGSAEASPQLLQDIADYLKPYCRIGHDLTVLPARYIALDIALTVCVLPHYLRGQVEAALLNVFSNRLLPNGRRGFFHPDNLTFGDDIYLSQLVAAAQAVPGVENVEVTKLQRLFEAPNGEIQDGVLSLSPLEVARLDNDPSFPEHGKLVLDMRGGR